jgi:hypothetical protein
MHYAITNSIGLHLALAYRLQNGMNCLLDCDCVYRSLVGSKWLLIQRDFQDGISAANSRQFPIEKAGCAMAEDGRPVIAVAIE